MVLSSVHVVLGTLLFTPLLFTIYVNDLPPSYINAIFLLFADDFFSPILMFDQLQGDIDVMMEWTKLWILSFTSQSTSIYKSEQITNSCYASYTLDSAVIGSIDCMTDLGINIDINLKPLCAQS